MAKVILFYKFIPIQNPNALMEVLRDLCLRLELRGRVLISDQGINGTLGGTKQNLQKYIEFSEAHNELCGINYKWSDGGDDTFPRLSIKVRDEIITFKAKDEITVDNNGIVGRAQHIGPDELHDLIQKEGDRVVFFDGRNSYESTIGRFKGAVLPNIANTKDFIEEIKDPKYDYLKDKILITYCTGGIRCEILGTLLKHRGFKYVYQLDGGIVSYCQKYGDKGLWEGSLYVFDRRMTIDYSNNPKKLGKCSYCGNETNRYINCANKVCNLMFLACWSCKDKTYCLNEPESAIVVVS